ncbi:MAG: DNA polymerase IV [Planctomycetes bacterium]|nr:DNA polymerase IV [Planctomycetota bacterium]
MILHIDMDAFFTSVEERDRPELAGKPVIVGGTPEGRGVVAAANYEVRKYGVHSAMPAATAKRLCPHAVFLRPRMSRYCEISEQIRTIFVRYTPLVEPLSVDEAFLDVTGTQGLFGPPTDLGRRLQREIRDELQLTASVGIASNKFLAKIASDLDKPDGFVVVEPGREQEFLDPLPISRLWGVGRATGEKLQKLGVQTIGQLRQLSADLLHQQFGKHGRHLWQLSHGIDERRVVPDREAKSISHETTFESDICEMETLRSWLLHLTEQVAHRLRRHDLSGSTVQIKVRYGDFYTITRAQTLPQPTHITREIWDTASRLLSERLPDRPLRIRLLGVGVSGFTTTGQTQQTLFADEVRDSQSRLDVAVDGIREQFGRDRLSRGSDLQRLP